jgi:hypothetical protein
MRLTHDSTSGSAGTALVRPGWWRPTTGCSGHTVSGDSRTEALRVAVLVESLTVPEWVEWTVATIDARDAFELTAVVRAADVRALPAASNLRWRARHLTYRFYEWVDRKVFGTACAMRDTDLSEISSGRTTFEGIGPLDVLVSFLSADRTAWDGPTPRHGVWAIVPMDDGQPASAPSRFWEVRGRSETVTAALVAVADGFARVIAKGSAPADPLSVTRTRNAAAWTSAHLVVRSLRSLHRDGSLVPHGEDLADPRDLPPPAVTVSHAARTAVRGVAAKSRTAWRRAEWFVAVRVRSADGRVHAPLRPLPNPVGRYLADPFPIEVNGRHFLFVEDYSHAARRAVISVSEAGPDDAWSPPRRVLECDYHLSYPFVFEHEGAIYMLPETGEAGRVELHRAVEFPHEWRPDRVLLDGVTAFDATLHIEDGLLWLFANIVEGHEDRGELWLFSSRSLDGEWRPHPQNPVVTDPGTARPAGRLFRQGGVLVRPSQDCSRGYGEAVVLNRVDVLSLGEYRETPVGRIEPDWMPGVEGTHTYTFDSRYECLDGYRHVRRLRFGRSGRFVTVT